MITITPSSHDLPDSNQTAEAFEQMLPTITRVAAYEFRHVPRRQRQEFVSDAVAAAYVSFARLVELGRIASACPSVIAKYAVKRIRNGRHVGVKERVRDVLSPSAQRQKRFLVELFGERDAHCEWEELTTGRKADPAQIAACRIDFRDWLGRLQHFKRRIALRLAAGDSTTEVARHFNLSLARISQLRQELKANWDEFQAVPAPA